MEVKYYMDSIAAFQTLETEHTELSHKILTSFFEKPHINNMAVYEDGRLKAMYYLTDEYNSVYIANIYVLSKFRNDGVGTRILNYLKETYNDEELTACPQNDDATRWFYRNGFEPESGDMDSFYFMIYRPDKSKPQKAFRKED
ncbi:GNAT superfamily N-acetyltransferase [Pedobacter sp. AK013]|uniref:GNAT family N-acetyltransferase n=1 Tax=Pedobacter sp. AK013 TaxID=2723071 RepID=UPI001617EDE9|nr:GNAT family N-acetyltransferase [Pedobacter sp. AK013]MBB6236517.1 GNAT superfamily N-acetyltransferase [Pedobacter sp. AK013]